VRLSQLAAAVPGARLAPGSDPEVAAVTFDSRRVSAGTLFVAIQGLRRDGLEYAPEAAARGAVAVAAESRPPVELPWLEVPEARAALGRLASTLLGRPADSLQLVGVTGTNGKSTTAALIEAALTASGRRTGLVGTVGHRIAGRSVPAVHTTPESSDLMQLFAEMREAGCDAAVLEVSSHALALKRVDECQFAVAVFTNLTRDHLDFHGDMDRYFAAKRELFTALLRPEGVAVLNADDPRTEELAAASRGRVWTYGLTRPADVGVEGLELGLDGSSFRARTPRGELSVRSPLLGRFNVSNLLAALTAGLALEVPPEALAESLGRFAGVSGRMERVEAGQPFAVIVDYAHTDDALRNLLEVVRELGPRRVITVFGCGGDRDRSKRPLMGAVAARLSDVVVLTSDNPRSEPPESILEEIQRGMNGGRSADRRHVISDRREAIARALSLAEPGDAVVIAGKGHETQQVLRDRSVPFDDRQVARDLLAPRTPGRRRA